MWTRILDMYSGGVRKNDFGIMYVELPENDAYEWFKENYQDPYHVTCDCCGNDYFLEEYDTVPPMDDADIIVKRSDL